MTERAVRCLALVLVLLLSGCIPRAALHARSDGQLLAPADPERAARFERIGLLLDQLQGLGQWYRNEEQKNHTKARVMGVFSGTNALVTAGLGVSTLAVTDDPAAHRTLVAFGATTGVFSLVLGILPWAHQYGLKEQCYSRAAALSEESYGRLADGCGAGLNTDSNLQELTACEARLVEAVETFRRFPEGTPCVPPPASQLARMIDRRR